MSKILPTKAYSTKGPWAISYAGIEKEINIYDKQHGDIIAKIDPVKENKNSKEVILANANLISVAPELKMIAIQYFNAMNAVGNIICCEKMSKATRDKIHEALFQVDAFQLLNDVSDYIYPERK